jgi:5-methyltetrahydrofolate corrinoid/iron sulfur protein methyltransferase
LIKVGEKLNSSIPRTSEAIRQRDKAALLGLAKRQLDGGADWLDVNAGVFMNGERDALLWMMDAVQRETGAKLMIDSQNAETIAAALAADSVGNAIINSVTLDDAKLDALLPLVKHYNTGIVALPISPSGMPKMPQARLANADRLLERITAEGIEPGRVYIDPLVGALSADSSAASIALETIRLFRAAHPEVNILCGLSNVSFGLPNRPYINAAFLAGVILAGANAAILDTADPALAQTIAAAEALSGRDPYCLGYLNYCRSTRQ